MNALTLIEKEEFFDMILSNDNLYELFESHNVQFNIPLSLLIKPIVVEQVSHDFDNS